MLHKLRMLLYYDKHGGFSWENVSRKNHGCGQKRPEGATSARFAVRTATNAVNSSVTLTEFAAEHTPRRQIRNLNSLPSTKKTTEFSFELLLSINKIVLTFVVSANMWVTRRFQTKNAGYSTGLSQVYATSYW